MFSMSTQLNSSTTVEVSTSSGNIANAVLAAAFRPLTQKQIYQLTEGKKHEIRRMLNALNLTINSLKRVRFLFLNIKIRVKS